MKKRILVPTDFSSSADMALIYALNFANYIGADEIYVLHAAQVLVSPADTVVPVAQILVEDAEKHQEKLKKKIESWPESKGMTIHMHILVEDVATAVSRYAEEIHPDYIVMGTNGASGIDEFMFGTTAATVLENSEVPVLVVPSYNAFHKPEHIVFAADLKNIADKEILSPLKNLVIGFNAKLVLLHISSDLELTAVEDKEKEELKEYFRGLDIHFSVVHSENIYTGIEIYMQDKVPDLVAVLSRRHGFLEKIFHTSIAKKIARRSLIPLLSLRETE